MASKDPKALNIFGVDDLLNHLGNPGRYSVLTFLLLALNFFPVVFHHVAMAFYGFTPPYDCRPKQIPKADVISVQTPSAVMTYNFSDVSAVMEDGSSVIFQRCDALVMSKGDVNRSVTCSPGETHYYLPEGEQTIVMEWDLVCERAFLSHLATTVYYCGVMLGGFFCGYLSDRLGRRPVILACLLCATVLGTGLAFVRDFPTFVALRFVLGFLTQGLHTASYIMVVEVFPTQLRTLMACVLQLFWGMSVLVLGGVAWTLKDWRLIQLAISLPSVLAIPYFWFLPESLRWLIAKNKGKEAERLIQRIAVFNRTNSILRHYPEKATDMLLQKPAPLICVNISNTDPAVHRSCSNTNISADHNQKNKDSKREKEKESMTKKKEEKLGRERGQASLRDLFSSRIMLKRSMILFYIWFAGNLSYYGLTFMSTSLEGHRFVNYTVSACVEVMAYASNIFIVKRFGRRNPLCFYYCVAATSCLGLGFLPKTTSSGLDLTKVGIALGVVGKFAASGSFTVFELLTVEMYPTVLRNVGAGMCVFWGRLGAVLAPQFLSLGLYTFSQLPAILIGALTLVGGALTLLLPDTSHASLPDIVMEVDIDADGKKTVTPHGALHVTVPLLTTEKVSSV